VTVRAAVRIGIALAVAVLAAACSQRHGRSGGRGGSDAGPGIADTGTVADGGGADGGVRPDGDAVPDAIAPPDTGFDAGRDAGFDAGSDAGFDAGRDAGFDAGRDAGFDAGFDGGFDAGPAPVTCTAGVCGFPSVGDRWTVDGEHLWMMGEYVEGSRTPGVASVTRVDAHMVYDYNGLSGDNQDMRILLNAVEIGRFSIAPAETSHDYSFTFPAIAGPVFVIRYENVREVTSGAGSARFDKTSSTLTFRP
jgi:hypothetical protein